MTEADFVVTPAQRRLPTALLLTTSGRVIGQFNLKTGGMMASELPRTFVKPALTYIFYEDNQQIVLVPKTRPAEFTALLLKKLPKFKPPLRPGEKMYKISTEFSQLTLYVDTLDVRKIRYQLRAPSAG